MFNNKGQSLVLFVILMPIFVILFTLVIDIGKIIVLKQELNNINNIVIDYGIDNIEMENLDDELIKLIKLNNNDIDYIDINIENEKIYVKISDTSKMIFSKIIGVSMFSVKSSYVGYIDENNKKRIERYVGDWYE